MSPPAADGHPLSAWLRERVIALRAETRRRNFPASVELVRPGAAAGTAPAAAWTYGDESCDRALRVDVLVRLLTQCRCDDVRVLAVVHVRPGVHEPADADLAWAAAASVAADISGVGMVTAVAVSRWGWRDLHTSVERTWSRPRAQRRPTG